MSEDTSDKATYFDFVKIACRWFGWQSEGAEEFTELAEYCEWLGLAEKDDSLEGLRPWEAEAYKHSAIIVVGRRIKAQGKLKEIGEALKGRNFLLEDMLKDGEPYVDGEEAVRLFEETNAHVIKNTSIALGSIVANQIIKGNYAALNVIGDGLRNLSAGRDFKPKAGRGKSVLGWLVLMAFHHLKKDGIEKPSQAEVMKFMNEKSKRSISKTRLSKLFDELGLKEEASDAREAMSQAGKRKRKRT